MKQLLLICAVVALVGCGEKTLEQRAEAGDAEAQNSLGEAYYSGKGVPEDHKEAVKWFRKAADQGIADAQKNLGDMYHQGKGVEQNYVTAYAWLNIAAANGHKIAKDNKPKIVTAMGLSPELAMKQIAKAEALAKGMLKKNPKLLKD